MNQPINALGNFLRARREDMKKKQREVAMELGIKQSNYCRYEIGVSMPRRKMIGKLAEYFGCSEEDLMDISYGKNSDFSRLVEDPHLPLVKDYLRLIEEKYASADESEKLKIRGELEKMVEPKKLV